MSDGLGPLLESEMMVKWKTCRYRNTQIECVECARETEKAVWVLEYPWTLDGGRGTKPPIERRRMKQSDGDNFHDTWESAHTFLMERAASELQAARHRLEQAQGTFGNAKSMRKPAESHEMLEQAVRA